MPPQAPRLMPPPVLLVITSIASTQLGSAIAKGLFNQVGPLGIVSLRVGLAALLLVLLWRPQWRGHRPQDYRLLLLFGLSLAAMNSLFYSSIARIPIGVAVALEFTGPLTVALFHSKRRLDFLWVALAAGGIVLLSPLANADLDFLGVILALAAGVCWGAYMVFSAKTGQVFPGSGGLAMAMAVGGLLLLPLGLWAEGANLLHPQTLMLGAAVAVLSSALPYSLELFALRHLPLNVFGVLMSLEPAIAALISFAVLGEQLTPRMMAAILCVTMAAAGASVKPADPLIMP